MNDDNDLATEVSRLPFLPDNQFCADCDAPNPDWASLNLGILICINCAGIHRNLGVHLSKVRSLHLDIDCWDENQLNFMKAIGNVRAKAIYEATCPCWYSRPTMYNDSTIVRDNWIRAKYERRDFAAYAKEPLSISVMPETPKEGYLWKANKKKTWQKRYMVLNGRYLYYFKSASDSYSKGIIDVCELEFKLPNGPDSNKRYVFEINTGSRVYPFGCESIQEMLDWVHALKRAAAYYITILNSNASVEELGIPPHDINIIKEKEKNIILPKFGEMRNYIKMGILNKQGGKWKSWNKRTCVLYNDIFYYFKKDKLSDNDVPEDGVLLQSSFVSNGDAKTGKQYCLSITTPTRVYFLCANNEGEKQEWYDVLNAACERLNCQRLVDFSQMEQPAPVRSLRTNNDSDDDSD